MSASNQSPMPGSIGATNLNNGTLKNPVIIAAIAPARLKPFQNRLKMIVGQNVAEIPDQPKITNQNTLPLPVSSATARICTLSKKLYQLSWHRPKGASSWGCFP